MLDMWIRTRTSRALLAAALTLAVAVPASAGTVYRWRTDEGTLAYSNSRKLIPERYRAKAEAVEMGTISGYKRYTPPGAAQGASYRARTAKHLERMRALNAKLDAQEAGGGSYAAYPSDTTVRVNSDGTESVEVAAGEGNEPVTVDDVRYSVPDSMATRHDTVVRQGGRLILVVRGEKNQSGLSYGELPDESELDLDSE